MAQQHSHGNLFEIIPSGVVDPVCGMTISPADATGTHVHNGVTYHFCHPGCLEKFKADPER